MEQRNFLSSEIIAGIQFPRYLEAFDSSAAKRHCNPFYIPPVIPPVEGSTLNEKFLQPSQLRKPLSFSEGLKEHHCH